MNSPDDKSPSTTAVINVEDSQPNEQGNVSIQGNVKISDPETNEVFINIRI